MSEENLEIKYEKAIADGIFNGTFSQFKEQNIDLRFEELEEKERIRSAMISSIIRPAGCYGVLYVDNAMVHKHYSLSDLDYLMLIAMHTAAVLKKFLD